MSKSTTSPVITPASVPPHPSQRFEWIDIAKGFACLLVIVGHTISPESALYRYIFSFHMPLFFILAGYTFKPKPLMSLVTSSAKRLLLPYTIVFLLWHGMLALKSGPITGQSILSLALTYIFASGIDLETPEVVAVGMAWFLVVLFFARILFNIAATAAQRSKKPLAVLGILSLISLALGYSLGARLGIYLPFSFDIALVAIFFMYVGYAAKQLDLFSKIESKWLALPISVLLWLVASSNSSLELATRAYHNVALALIAAIAGTLSVCLAAAVLSKASHPAISYSIKKPLLFYGREGMAVYCMHALDWWIAWSSLPFLVGMPFSNGIASIVRIMYCTGFVLLLRTA